jgi:hypothetical protein
MLRNIVKDKKVEWYEGVGEAAFYGPKLDFMASDALGREWQVATIQLDVNMPERFDLYCMNEKGEQALRKMIAIVLVVGVVSLLWIWSGWVQKRYQSQKKEPLAALAPMAASLSPPVVETTPPVVLPTNPPVVSPTVSETSPEVETKPVEIKPIKLVIDQTNSFVELSKPNNPDDSGFSTIPGSLLGRADDLRRPNLCPNFGDWVKKKEEEPTFDALLIEGEQFPKWNVPRTNKLRGVIQTVHITSMITEVFGGKEDDLGQVKFQDKRFLLSLENLKMFKKALWFVFGATYTIE